MYLSPKTAEQLAELVGRRALGRGRHLGGQQGDHSRDLRHVEDRQLGDPKVYRNLRASRSTCRDAAVGVDEPGTSPIGDNNFYTDQIHKTFPMRSVLNLRMLHLAHFSPSMFGGASLVTLEKE